MAPTLADSIPQVLQNAPVTSVAVAFLLIAAYRKLTAKDSSKSALPLPPGPKGKPIIKNLLDIPFERQWEAITELEKQYGDMIYFSVAGQNLIYVNSFDVAIDLFEKRSSRYSDRAHTTMMTMMGAGDILSLMRYGDDWRLSRRLFHQEFNINTPLKYKDTQMKYAHGTLKLLKDDPGAFEKHFKYFTAGVVLEPVYGFKIKPEYDPYVRAAEEGTEFVQGLMPGAFLVDAFPFLKYLPEWFPGAAFKKKARIWGKSMLDSVVEPFKAVSTEHSNGTAAPSFTATWLSKISHHPPEERQRLENLMLFVSGTAFLAGYETTSGTFLNFVFHMLDSPHVQAKAHEELDRVIGRSRLPDLEDRESLPYINAICKEVLRVHPVLPLGIPHVAIAEDEYKGMQIPKNSIIVPNVWAMSRNVKDNGPNPDEFRPERFLEGERRDPATYVFGFGRRICPGRFVAENSIFIVISNVLQTFNITRAKDESGKEKPLDPFWISGATVHLAPFPASFDLRFEGADRLSGTL